MTDEEKEAIKNTKKKIETTQKGLEEGKYYGERFNLEQDIKREQALLNYIDKLKKENIELKNRYLKFIINGKSFKIKNDVKELQYTDFKDNEFTLEVLEKWN